MGRRWRLGADVRAWRSSREYRLLLASRTVTMVGSMVTYVAVPYQIKVLTDSFVAVGLVGLVELVPVILFGLYGGALADAVDRRRLAMGCEAALAVAAGVLLVNAMLPHPALWVIYVLAGVLAALSALQEPAVDAMLPRVVARDQITGAIALSSACSNLAQIGGPAVGGLLLTAVGPGLAYGVDVVSFVASLVALSAMRAVPPPEGAGRASVGGILEGLRYAASRQVLVGTYVVDIAAMVFALPTTLLPFLADRLHAPWSLGLLYAAPAVGGLLVSVTSGWTARVARHGAAVAWAAAAWGLSITVLGLVGQVWLALLCLVAAGAADMVSGLFRSTIWNQTIPDAVRGRLAGVELLSYTTGPVLGQVRGGAAAALVGVSAALWSGGVLCVVAVVALSARLPEFWSYRAEPDVGTAGDGDAVAGSVTAPS